ncbi:MAG: SH3 domain-containing protein [Acidobacteriota bacterium]|nr:SH3 domain-containing protein [Acidobacteriota bacterium]MDQ7088184.1 SH3 domain-containing protein [Acidobacteriota bacterium]
MKRMPAMLAVLLALSTLGPSRAATPEALFARAAEAYESGDYARAESLWQQVADGGVIHESVYYNLGCAQARAGRLGPAALSFRRALWLAPRDEDARANLQWVTARLTDAPPDEGFRWRWALARATALVPARGGLIVGLAMEWLAAGLLALGLLAGRPRLRRPALALAVVAALLLTPVVIRLGIRQSERGAVILAERVEVRSGPGAANPVLFTVHEGFPARIGERREGWVRIRAAGGLAGWVPEGSLATVRPAAATDRPIPGDRPSPTRGGSAARNHAPRYAQGLRNPKPGA